MSAVMAWIDGAALTASWGMVCLAVGYVGDELVFCQLGRWDWLCCAPLAAGAALVGFRLAGWWLEHLQ